VTADVEEKAEPRFYRKAFCPNCGLFPLPMADAPVKAGDKIVVNKSAFWLRAPERWEIVVFRLLGTFFIKRLLGLPGEEIEIADGDVYVNGELLRKNLDELKRMRMLVFDHAHAPAGGWKSRFEFLPSPLRGRGAGGEGAASRIDNYQLTIDNCHLKESARSSICNGQWSMVNGQCVDAAGPAPPAPLPRRGEGSTIVLDGRATPDTLTYRNFSLDTRKCEPLRDEYAYNAGLHADSACVHDFSIDSEIEAIDGRGTLALRLCDGHDWIEVTLPVGQCRRVEAFAWPVDSPQETRKLGESELGQTLHAHTRYRVELAFVDRRVMLAVDGKNWLSVDLPAAKNRQGVEQPFQVVADGVQARMNDFRLYRDIHYGQQGTNGVRGKSVRLDANQYFMLGDNIPRYDDSRFSPDDRLGELSDFIGSMLFVHGSSR